MDTNNNTIRMWYRTLLLLFRIQSVESQAPYGIRGHAWLSGLPLNLSTPQLKAHADVCLAVLASPKHMQRPKACAPSEVLGTPGTPGTPGIRSVLVQCQYYAYCAFCYHSVGHNNPLFVITALFAVHRAHHTSARCDGHSLTRPS
jgi:hypothetical protein